jgi:hypothetical protein
VSVYWLPLYVLLLRRVVRKPGWGTGVAAGLVLIPACLIHVMHVAYFILPVTVAVFLAALVELKAAFFSWRRIRALILVFGLAALVVVPLLLPTVLRATQEDSYLQKWGTVLHSTDLLAFFTPSPYHPVLRALGLVPAFADRIFLDEEYLYERLAYPGVLAVGLAVWGLIRRRRQAWVWGLLALAAAVLALGPLLKIGNELAVYRVEEYRSHVVLPYALLTHMPLLEIGRTPGRLNETAMFGVAILASYGVAGLASLLAKRPRLLGVLVVALLVGIGFEYVAIWPFPAGTASGPPAIERIAGEPGDGALLHVLMKRRWVNHRALYYQTVAQRPVVGGEVHRAIPEALAWSETLLGLAQPEPAAGDVVPRPDLATRVGWLRDFGVDYVLFQKMEGRDDSVERRFVEGMLGVAAHEDDTLAAFPVPGDAPAMENSLLYAFSRYGWDDPEQDGDGWRRWMEDEGRLYVYSTREEPSSLRFTVDSDLAFPVLEVYLGERLLDSFVVGERTTYTTRPFTLAPGMNVFRFRAPGGCSQELDDGSSCRTFAFDRVSCVPQADLRPGEALDVDFGGQVRLRGWEWGERPVRPGGMVAMTLDWEPSVALGDEYVGFVHVLSPDGVLVAQHDAPLTSQCLPAATWLPETVFRCPVTVELPDDLPAGDYRLLAGVYRWPSLERLPVQADVPGAEVGAVELGSVGVSP